MCRALVNRILISSLQECRIAAGSCRYVATAEVGGAPASSGRERWWTTKVDLSDVVMFGSRCLFPVFRHVLQMPTPVFIV